MGNISYLGSQGSKAATNGREFEKISGLKFDKLHPKYSIDIMEGVDSGYNIFDGSKVVCESYPKGKLEVYLNKNGLYRKEKDIECDEDLEDVGVYVDGVINIETIEPDDCIINNLQKTIYVVEQKFQKNGGSVDEKLRTYSYRQEYFDAIFKPLGLKVKLIYVLNDWFKKKRYNFVKKRMVENGVDIYYNSLPPHAIGLDEISENNTVKNMDIPTLW